MHFTVHEVSAYLVTVKPEAGNRIESFLIVASPITAKSAPLAPSPAPGAPSDQVRKPNDLMRSLRMFSATEDGTGGLSARSASRTEICTDTLGSPLARMNTIR